MNTKHSTMPQKTITTSSQNNNDELGRFQIPDEQKKQDDLVHLNNFSIYPHYNCDCQVCQENCTVLHLPEGDLIPQSDVSDIKEDCDIMSTYDNDPLIRKNGQFFTLIQRLQPVPGKTRPLNLNIQDTIFFLNKDPVMVVFNQGNTGQLNFLCNRDKLNLSQLRLFFIKRRQDYDYKSRLEFIKSQPKLVMDAKQSVESIRVPQLAPTEKSFALLYFNQKETSQVVTQQEFNMIMERRKVDPLWEKLMMIQCYNTENKEIIQVKFVLERECKKNLFKKALDDISELTNQNYWINKFSYDEQNFEAAMKRNNLDNYLKYLSYKIYHYVEAHHQIKIKRVILEFIRDDLKNFLLISCKQLAYVDANRIDHHDYFLHYIKYYSVEEREEILRELEVAKRKKINEAEQRDPQRRSLINLSEASSKYRVVNEFMNQNTEILKQDCIAKIELAYEQFDNLEDKKKSNHIFHQINQKATQDLTNLIQVSIQSQLHKKTQLLNNFPMKKMNFISKLRHSSKGNNKLKQREAQKQSQNVSNSATQRSLSKGKGPMQWQQSFISKRLKLLQQQKHQAFDNINNQQEIKIEQQNNQKKDEQNFQSKQQIMQKAKSQITLHRSISQRQVTRPTDYQYQQKNINNNLASNYVQPDQISCSLIREIDLDQFKVEMKPLSNTQRMTQFLQKPIERSPSSQIMSGRTKASNSTYCKNLCSPLSKNISNVQLKTLMSDQSQILLKSKLPNYLFQKGDSFAKSLPILINKDSVANQL